MKLTIILCLALVLSGGLFGCSTTTQSSRQDDVTYSKASPDSLRQIKAERICFTPEQWQKLTGLPKTKSKFGVRWFAAEEPDTTREGPWVTRISIFRGGETNHCIRLELSNHISAGVRPSWINEKLLFVNVWWGRIAWTDFIVNTQTLHFDYIEDGRDHEFDAR